MTPPLHRRDFLTQSALATAALAATAQVRSPVRRLPRRQRWPRAPLTA